MPMGIRPKGKARKIKEAIMGPMMNEPKKKKKLKSQQVENRLAFEESSRVK